MLFSVMNSSFLRYVLKQILNYFDLMKSATLYLLPAEKWSLSYSLQYHGV